MSPRRLVAPTLGLLLASAAGARASPPTVHVVPAAARPGDAVRLEVRAEEGPVEAVLAEHRFALAASGAIHVGYLALPLEVAPGPHPVVVHAGRSVVTATVGVIARRFSTSALRVAPRFTTPERPAAVEARIARERARVAALWARPPSPVARLGPALAPLEGRLRRTSTYGAARVFNGEVKRRHYGLDLAGRIGRPVRAPWAGRVVLVGERYFSGGTVVLDHGGGLMSFFFHLSRTDVEVGEAVERGGPLGAVGATGRVTGPHLHWSVAVRAEPVDGGPARGLYVDPEPFLDARRREAGRRE